MLSSSAIFDTLPPRPPTPPRETHGDVCNAVDDAITFLDDSHEIDRALTVRSTGVVNARSHASISLAETPNGSRLAKGGKKVDFSPQLAYHTNIDAPRNGSTPAARIPQQSPAAVTKPLRSILKATSQSTPLTPEEHDSRLNYFSPDKCRNMEDLLVSVVNQLRSGSRSMRLDAYLALNGAVQAYEDVPDGASLTRHAKSMSHFLERDLVCKTENGELDQNIVSQALRLATFLIFDVAWSAAIDDDFRSFVLTRSIEVLEQTNMPKAIFKLHMNLLAQQKFSAAIMTSTRADKIVTALQSIEERCSGNNVIVVQMMIYRRLIDQKPGVMLARIRDWLEQIIHCVLSSFREIKARAIKTFLHAGAVLGTQPQATRAVLDLLETEVEDGKTYCEYLNERLLEMIIQPDTAVFVPQIWSAVVLFLRGKRKVLEGWMPDKVWFSIVQKCFNCSDAETKHEATLAWNRLVFVIMPNSSTSKSMMETLKTPVQAGLVRRGARDSSLSSYYNLLHYALRPGLSPQELETAWDYYVKPLPTWMSKSHDKGCNSIVGMVDSFCRASSGVWNSDAALQSAPVKLTELPKLGARWVRSHLDRFLDLLEPFISASIRLPFKGSVSLSIAFHVLMETVAEAGAQEVRASNDLKQAIAILMSMFCRLWDNHFKHPNGPSDGRSLLTYMCLVDITIDTLGARHFVDEFLTMTEGNAFKVAPTSSNRRPGPKTTAQAPFTVLACQFANLSSSIWSADDHHASDAFSKLLKQLPSGLAQNSRFETLKQCLDAGAERTPTNKGLSGRSYVWLQVADVVMFDLRDTPSLAEMRQMGSKHLRSAIDILVEGLDFASDSKCRDKAVEFYDLLLRIAVEWGLTGVIIKPMAEALATSTANVDLTTRAFLAQLMLSKCTEFLQLLTAIRKMGSGSSSAFNKDANPDPLSRVIELVTNLLSYAYLQQNSPQAAEPGVIKLLVTASIRTLELDPTLLLDGPSVFQTGFAQWIEDAERKTATPPNVAEMVQQAWASLVATIRILPQHDSRTLAQLDLLFSAGFCSPHRSIVNETASLWNHTFGRTSGLAYPPRLAEVLQARVRDVHIDLPNFPDDTSAQKMLNLPDYYRSDEQPIEKASIQENTDTATQSGEAGATATAPAELTSSNDERLPTQSADEPTHVAPVELQSSTLHIHPEPDYFDVPFITLGSSPIRQGGESPSVVETWRENEAQQEDDEQALPENSSPVKETPSYLHSVSKRLTFDVNDHQQQHGGNFGTPTGPHDANLLLSDDPPSSPTPSSSRKAAHSAPVAADDDEEEEVLEDPPSSPPESAHNDVGEDEPAISDQMQHAQDHEATYGEGRCAVEDTTEEPLETFITFDPDDDDETIDRVRAVVVADLSTDRQEATSHLAAQSAEESTASEILQNAQIREHDVNIQPPSAHPDPTIMPTGGKKTEGLGVVPKAADKVAEPVDSAESPPGEAEVSCTRDTEVQNAPDNGEVSADSEDIDLTRVEDSFVEPITSMDGHNSPSPPNTQDSQRRSRKRKRSSAVVYTKKKTRTSQGRSSVEIDIEDSQMDEEDMDDEIVVVPRQTPSQADEGRHTPLARIETGKTSPEREGGNAEKEQAVTEIKSSRKRGRPRKNANTAIAGQENSQSQAETVVASGEVSVDEVMASQAVDPPKTHGTRSKGSMAFTSRQKEGQELDEDIAVTVGTRSRKRKAALINDDEDQSVVSVGSDTSNSTAVKSRKSSRRQDAATAEALQDSHESSELRRSQRARQGYVVIQSPPIQADDQSTVLEHDDEEIEHISGSTPEEQLRAEQEAAEHQRLFATPRSILGRLRDALKDLGSMFLSKQQEREFDDVLFELRRGVHDAAGRGQD